MPKEFSFQLISSWRVHRMNEEVSFYMYMYIYMWSLGLGSCIYVVCHDFDYGGRRGAELGLKQGLSEGSSTEASYGHQMSYITGLSYHNMDIY